MRTTIALLIAASCFTTSLEELKKEGKLPGFPPPDQLIVARHQKGQIKPLKILVNPAEHIKILLWQHENAPPAFAVKMPEPFWQSTGFVLFTAAPPGKEHRGLVKHLRLSLIGR